MKLSEYNKKGDDYTGKASEIVRQMLLGGIALIWLFKETDGTISKIDRSLLYPTFTICLALIFDLLQYVVGGHIWKQFFRAKEGEVIKSLKGINQPTEDERDPDVKAPKSLGNTIYFFYWGKIGLMILSYIMIIKYIVDRLNFT
jgi:hypothetical protein